MSSESHQFMKIKDIYSKEGLVIQQLSYTCGPTSLLNALKLKGETSLTERDLAKLCSSNKKDGTTHPGLIEGAAKAGLKVGEHKDKASIKDVERNIDNGAF